VLDTLIANNVITATSIQFAIHVGTGIGSASKNSFPFGITPVSSSYKTTPNAQISARLSTLVGVVGVICAVGAHREITGIANEANGDVRLFWSARGGSAILCAAETGSRDVVGLQCRKNAPFTLKVTSSITGIKFESPTRVPSETRRTRLRRRLGVSAFEMVLAAFLAECKGCDLACKL
jgi:hypothetical protein